MNTFKHLFVSFLPGGGTLNAYLALSSHLTDKPGGGLKRQLYEIYVNRASA